jgi:hypothetical protein
MNRSSNPAGLPPEGDTWGLAELPQRVPAADRQIWATALLTQSLVEPRDNWSALARSIHLIGPLNSESGYRYLSYMVELEQYFPVRPARLLAEIAGNGKTDGVAASPHPPRAQMPQGGLARNAILCLDILDDIYFSRLNRFPADVHCELTAIVRQPEGAIPSESEAASCPSSPATRPGMPDSLNWFRNNSPADRWSDAWSGAQYRRPLGRRPVCPGKPFCPRPRKPPPYCPWPPFQRTPAPPQVPVRPAPSPPDPPTPRTPVSPDLFHRPGQSTVRKQPPLHPHLDRSGRQNLPRPFWREFTWKTLSERILKERDGKMAATLWNSLGYLAATAVVPAPPPPEPPAPRHHQPCTQHRAVSVSESIVYNFRCASPTTSTQ